MTTVSLFVNSDKKMEFPAGVDFPLGMHNPGQSKPVNDTKKATQLRKDGKKARLN